MDVVEAKDRSNNNACCFRALWCKNIIDESFDMGRHTVFSEGDEIVDGNDSVVAACLPFAARMFLSVNFEETVALVLLQAWGGGQVQAESWEVAGVGGVERCLGEYLAEWGVRARPCWNGWRNFEAGGECLQPHIFSYSLLCCAHHR